MTYRVLALDQSARNTGWAFMEKDGAPTWGSFLLGPWEDHEGERMLEFDDWFDRAIHSLKVTHVFIEMPATQLDHRESLSANIATFGIPALIAMVCKNYDIELAVVTPSSWRTAFIGTGSAPKGLVQKQRRPWLKEQAKKACAARGWLVANDNEAEALGILNYGIMSIDPVYASRQGPLFRRAEMAFDNLKRAMR